MKVYEAITAAIVDEGADTLFAVMGDANQDLIVDLVERHGLKLVHCKNEMTAVAAADGYSRFTGKLGVATVTQGPGYTNATTSLIGARLRRSPVLLIAGHTSLSDPYNPQGAIDQQALANLTTGAGYTLNHPKNLDFALAQTFRHIRGGHGPFILNLPQDVQKSPVADSHWHYKRQYRGESASCARAEDITSAINLICKAKRPGLLCGRGAVNAEAGMEIRALADILGAPIAVTLLAKGFCCEHPLYLGVCGGLGDGTALKVFEECDLILAFGASLNAWTTHFGTVLKNKTLIQCDNRQEAFGWFSATDVTLEGDAKKTALQINEKLAGINIPNVRKETEKAIANAKPAPCQFEDGGAVDPRRAIWYLENALPKDNRTIIIDGGHGAMVANQILSAWGPRNWDNGLEFGAVGQGLAIAIGACFAKPGSPITHVTGDAAFIMNIADFHTAVSYGLPLNVFILNDNALGQEKHDLVHKHLNPKYAQVVQPDFAELARGFGARGYKIESPTDLSQIDEALREGSGPAIVDIRINGDFELPVSWEIAKHLS
jgi:acetolactate synthase-1/2/3 large subunit